MLQGHPIEADREAKYDKNVVWSDCHYLLLCLQSPELSSFIATSTLALTESLEISDDSNSMPCVLRCSLNGLTRKMLAERKFRKVD